MGIVESRGAGAMAVCFLFAAAGNAGEWGNLQGRFVYQGSPPVRQPIKVTADKEYCGKFKLLEERLVVHPEHKGVANVIVWLYLSRQDGPPPVHESFATTAKDAVVLESTRCRIDPHATLLRTSQTLRLRNTDPIGDGIKIDSLINPPMNILLAPGGEQDVQLLDAERLPARVSCPIHPWESGWLLVQEHPYMAVSDEAGHFEIGDLPAGTWTFQFWHETAGYLQEVSIGGKPTTWRRGRVEIAIASPGTDLGTIELAPGVFE